MRLFPSFRLLNRVAFLAWSPLLLFVHHVVAAPATPKYVQGNYTVPQTSQTAVTAPYIAAQTGGNLNVVIVGWNDATTNVSSVTDSNGNVYRLAVGPTAWDGGISQAIYYAENISAAAAGANTVEVTFDGSVNYPDVRVLEYSGIDPVNPVDVVAGASGNSATASSGAVTTTDATDLLVGANTVQTATLKPGTGFAERLLTDPDGDCAEDLSTTATGTYTATAPLTYSGGWVMQVVAFRAAGSTLPPPP
jgi:hypothetical protein